jgi:hypothetical protein
VAYEEMAASYQDILERVIILEGGCVPDCEGKECGDDGCGGSCGACETGYYCDNGICVEECTVECLQEYADCLDTLGDPYGCLPVGSTDCTAAIERLISCAINHGCIDLEDVPEIDSETWEKARPCMYYNCLHDYRQVYGSGGGPLIGDTCAYPLIITEEDTWIVGYTTNIHHDNYISYCGGDGDDVIYAYTSPSDGTLEIHLEPSFDGILYAFTDCSDPDNTMLGCSDDNHGTNQHECLEIGVTSDQTIYIVVDCWNWASGGIFSIAIHFTV